jgi:CubicO group peptidase (beta-lactamase class C family)
MVSGRLSPERLDRMRSVMSGYVDRGELPGLVTLVSRRGDVQVDAFGTTAVGGRDPMRRDSIFRVASMSKPVTAVAAMILVEECKLRLDDPVDPLLPELADRHVLRTIDSPVDDTVPAHRPITLRDLLTFRLGTGLVMAPPGTYPIQKAMDEALLPPGPPSPSAMPAPDDWIAALGTLPLVHQPGERWMYNTGSDVLGVLVARAAGQSFESFLHDRIFEPLGMRDTDLSVPANDLDRFTTSYSTNFETGEPQVYDEPNGQWSQPPAFASGAGGLVSTVDDFFVFGRMMLDGGVYERTRILSRPSIEVMTIDHLTDAQKAGAALVPGYFDSHGWGFGMSVVTRRTDIASTVGKYGWDGGLGTSWYCDPAEDMVTILLTQSAFTSPDPPRVCVDFWTTAYQAIDD